MAGNKNQADETKHRAAGAEGRPGRSRRGLLVGAAAGLGALAAETIAPAQPAAAAQGQNVILGADNTGATNRTGIFTTNNNEWAQLADPGNAGLGSQGVYGAGQNVGVRGEAANGPGVIGKFGITGGSGGGNGTGVAGFGGGIGPGVLGTGGTSNGVGVRGDGGASNGHGVEGVGTGSGNGVSGSGGASGGIGVVGQGGGSGGAGVVGTGGGTGPGVVGNGSTGLIGNGAGSGGVGVFGAGGPNGGTGVLGHAGGAGDGVHGNSTGGNAVAGFAGGANGAGVRGEATDSSAIGVIARNDAASSGGVGLSVMGVSQFTRSGAVPIAFPAKSATVSVPGGLTSSALVLALMQNSVSGVYVASAVPSTLTGQVTINLNKTPGSSTSPKTAQVAWFIVN